MAELVLDKLRELQQADKQLRRLEEQKTGHDRKVKVRADQITRQEQSIDALKDKHRNTRKTVDGKELEVKQKRADIERLKSQQMQVKDNRQFSILQNEIKFLELAIGKLEDEILADMDDVEAADKDVKEAQAQVARARVELEALRAEIESKKDEVDADIAKCRAQREDIARTLPQKVVDQFTRIADRLRGEALASVIRDEEDDESGFMCGGCNMGLTQNTYVRLAGHSDDLVTCPNCTRILYLEET